MIKQVQKLILKEKYLLNINKCYFSQNNKKSQKGTVDDINDDSLGKYKGLIYTMRKDSQIGKKSRAQQKSLHKYGKTVQDHLVQLTLYMRHNNWKSQFIYSLLNYNKLGFKVVSDYAFLDSSSYMLQLRNIKQEDRWPTVRVIIGLKPRVIVTGAQEIQKFFVQNMYFQKTLLNDAKEFELIKRHIDGQILPYMESLLWHPTLTYQTTFHTDLYYHQSQQKNYMLVNILIRNFSAVGKAVFGNMFKILSQKQRYFKSKEKFSNELKNLSDMFLTKNQYFGGQKPSFIDFYLYSHLRTKWESKYFKNYIQDEISDQFKRWLLRMGWSCQYVRDRVTVL